MKITDEMVDAALDAWYPGEDWRTVLEENLDRYRSEMRAAIEAALAAAWRPISEAENGPEYLVTDGKFQWVVHYQDEPGIGEKGWPISVTMFQPLPPLPREKT